MCTDSAGVYNGLHIGSTNEESNKKKMTIDTETLGFL